MGPCMCGDTQCPSCGPAQGNSRCPVCRAWLDDGCEHIAEDGTIVPEFQAAVDAAEAAERASEHAYALDLEHEAYLADLHWRNTP